MREQEVIRDAKGNIIQRSRNLAGIRRYVSHNLIKVMSVDRIADGEGKLCILFVDGSSFETNFADYTVLKDFVRRWRNVYGAPLIMAGQDCEKVSSKNVWLVEENLW